MLLPAVGCLIAPAADLQCDTHDKRLVQPAAAGGAASTQHRLHVATFYVLKVLPPLRSCPPSRFCTVRGGCRCGACRGLSVVGVSLLRWVWGVGGQVCPFCSWFPMHACAVHCSSNHSYMSVHVVPHQQQLQPHYCACCACSMGPFSLCALVAAPSHVEVCVDWQRLLCARLVCHQCEPPLCVPPSLL